MPSPFDKYQKSITSGAVGSTPITPSDSVDLTTDLRGITVGGAGTLSWVSSVDGQTYTTNTLPATTYALFIRRVNATGTTATDLTGWL